MRKKVTAPTRDARKSSVSALELVTRSPEETHAIGARLGSRLRPPEVVLLVGPLGVGKTTLARGIAEGIGVDDPLSITSPSFALVNTYAGKHTVYHVDLYRLGSRHDFATVGVDEFIGAQGVTIVEWGERLPIRLPSVIIVRIRDAGGDRRKLRIEAAGKLLKALKKDAPGGCYLERESQ
ncbi:MAG: tRNA (adenosine(37)-N6)-threonylcarbamoyltransferase complex ATPase subunit type 1 TsaE [Acidobacteria bacterium]|nr:tRNA (adenosine(37)-N6)-threonylcarbamoyltransferase complex ATPase subunit type 1 TsaE [Acidobacteriota bacterium]